MSSESNVIFSSLLQHELYLHKIVSDIYLETSEDLLRNGKFPCYCIISFFFPFSVFIGVTDKKYNLWENLKYVWPIVLTILPWMKYGEARCSSREKPEDVLQFCYTHSSLGENTTHHARPLGFGQEAETERGTICHLYCGFCGKKQVRHNKQALGWLVQVISVGSGAQGLSLLVWYLSLGQLDV